jgi:AraC-like DNA-binding protein
MKTEPFLFYNVQNGYVDVTSTTHRKIIDFRNYGFSELVVLGRYNYNTVQPNLTDHVHENMVEICYCDKGSQYFSVNNEQYLVKGGDIFLHFPNEVHGSGGHAEEKGCLYWIIIKLEDPSPSKLVDLCNLLVSKKIRHFRSDKEVKKKLEELFTAFEREENLQIKKIRLQVIAESLLLSVLDSITHEKKDTDHSRLNKILNYIDDNVRENISIERIADLVNLSESRFKSLFKELTGYTPGDYIQRKKVEYALIKLAENPKTPLSHLAYELNFSSPQYFSSVIKKYTGKTPGAIKKR